MIPHIQKYVTSGVERFHGVVQNIERSIFQQSSLPYCFWPEGFCILCF
jgi:hypothetical protein